MGCEIMGKAEFMNPGGSVKDRAALFMVKAAEAEGKIRPGGTIVEGTAGNTGIGLVSFRITLAVQLDLAFAGRVSSDEARSSL